MTYVYPVVSRRAGGVSVGINLNPNNACNWRCIYCQVPGLTRGSAPTIDLSQLETELRTLLDDLVRGDFMQRRVPESARRIEDIALSGNGEPTSAVEFPEVVALIARLRDEFSLCVPVRLITNGSLVDRPRVQEGLRRLAENDGEVWFKLDAGSREGMATINSVEIEPASIIRRLTICSSLCNTWVQTCCFALDGQAPTEAEQAAWLEVLRTVCATQPKVSDPLGSPSNSNPHPLPARLIGVHLYGLARASYQPEATRLSPVSVEWMESLGERAKKLGLSVRISP